MLLNNKKADEYLANLANDIKNYISNSSNNDEIFEYLDLLNEFVYKVPNQTIDVFKSILKTNYPTIKSRSELGSFEGKTRNDVVLRGLDLLSNIRYILPNTVLPLLEKVTTDEEKAIRERALEVLKRFSKYDYAVLYKSKIGYRAQRTALDYILKWSSKKRLANLDLVLVIVKELLSSSVEGSSWTDEKTLSMSFSHVDPTDFLKKIRRDVMDLVLDLYNKASDPKIRLELSSTLEEALRGPGNVKYSDELRKMLDEDAVYLAGIYQKMIFDKSGNIIRENVAVAEEIEERMYYFAKPEKGHPTALAKLREDILNDPFYKKVHPMIGGRASYRGDDGYEESRQRREEDQRDTVAQISEENVAEWIAILDILAKQKNVIEEWKLGDLKRFLELLSMEKPDMADRFMQAAFKKKGALVNFSESFLIGFQVVQRVDLWDKYVELISKKQDAYLAGGICNSLLGYTQEQLPRKLRPNEISTLEEIVFKTKRFAFLKTKKKDNALWYLHDRLFHALAFNSKPQQQKMELLIKEEMEKNQEYAHVHYNGLQFVATVWKWLDLSSTSKAFKKFLLKKVVEVPDLDWHLQEFLIALCNKDFDCIIDVFRQRIVRAVMLNKKDKSRGMKRLLKRKEFEAMPYHVNPDLQKLLTEDAERLSNILKSWMRKMTSGWSLYNWEVSRFLESVKADRWQVLSDIIAKGSDQDLLRVAYAIESISRADIDLCMQIVGQTDSKRIHRKIQSIMYSTGTVSGEYGIADAYKGKIEALQKYKKSTNKRIKNFATEMIGYLQKSEVAERKRVAEEIQLRKIQFEG